MCDRIYCSGNVIDRLIKLLNYRAIAEVLLKIICIDAFKEIENKEKVL